jgi:hypothetical protein
LMPSITKLFAKLLLTDETLTAGGELVLSPMESTPVVDTARIRLLKNSSNFQRRSRLA